MANNLNPTISFPGNMESVNPLPGIGSIASGIQLTISQLIATKKVKVEVKSAQGSSISWEMSNILEGVSFFSAEVARAGADKKFRLVILNRNSAGDPSNEIIIFLDATAYNIVELFLSGAEVDGIIPPLQMRIQYGFQNVQQDPPLHRRQ